MISAFCSIWRRIVRGAFVVATLTGGAYAQTPPAPQPRVTIGYVDITGDPRHEPIKAYERIVLKPREPPFAAAQVGIEEAQALSRVIKIDFALERITVKSAEEVAPAVTKALQERNIHFF